MPYPADLSLQPKWIFLQWPCQTVTASVPDSFFRGENHKWNETVFFAATSNCSIQKNPSFTQVLWRLNCPCNRKKAHQLESMPAVQHWVKFFCNHAEAESKNCQSIKFSVTNQWIFQVPVKGGNTAYKPWYSIFCLLVGYIIPTTLRKNQNNPLNKAECIAVTVIRMIRSMVTYVISLGTSVQSLCYVRQKHKAPTTEIEPFDTNTHLK